MSPNGKRAAKFIACYDGPYPVIDTHPAASTVTLDLVDSSAILPTFHNNLVKPFLPNDDVTYPHRAIDETQDFFVETVVNHHVRGRSYQFLVKFQEYPDYYDRWLSGKDLEGDSALADYLSLHPNLF